MGALSGEQSDGEAISSREQQHAACAPGVSDEPPPCRRRGSGRGGARPRATAPPARRTDSGDTARRPRQEARHAGAARRVPGSSARPGASSQAAAGAAAGPDSDKEDEVRSARPADITASVMLAHASSPGDAAAGSGCGSCCGGADHGRGLLAHARARHCGRRHGVHQRPGAHLRGRRGCGQLSDEQHGGRGQGRMGSRWS